MKIGRILVQKESEICRLRRGVCNRNQHEMVYSSVFINFNTFTGAAWVRRLAEFGVVDLLTSSFGVRFILGHRFVWQIRASRSKFLAQRAQRGGSKEAVGEGVAGGSELAFGRDGSFRSRSVGPGGFDLALGAHSGCEQRVGGRFRAGAIREVGEKPAIIVFKTVHGAQIRRGNPELNVPVICAPWRGLDARSRGQLVKNRSHRIDRCLHMLRRSLRQLHTLIRIARLPRQVVPPKNAPP